MPSLTSNRQYLRVQILRSAERTQQVSDVSATSIRHDCCGVDKWLVAPRRGKVLTTFQVAALGRPRLPEGCCTCGGVSA